MSQTPSRAARRHSARGNDPNHRKPRDPMNAIYIGFAVVIVLIFAGFGLQRFLQNQQIAAAIATPTPGPNASSKPIQLTDGMQLGKAVFPAFNTHAGGQGDAVDGITCGSMEYNTLHIHAHLTLFVNGVMIAIPRFVGGVQFPKNQGGCLYWLHTHWSDGIIHIESPDITAPQTGGAYTLGMLFDIWGEPLDATHVAKFKGTLAAFVNGAPWIGDPRSIPLAAHQQITLEVGTPIVPAPNYVFPPID